MVKVIGHKTTLPPKTDGSPSHIHQVATMCPPMWAHWHHLANTIELVLPSAHPSPQHKWQIDRFSCVCAAHSRVLSRTLVPPGEYDWNCAHWRHLANMIELVLPLAHPSPQPKGQIDWFSHFCTAHGSKSLYFTMTLSPKIAPHLTLFLGPIQTHNPNVILIGSAVFAQMTAECSNTWQWDALSPLKIATFHGDLDSGPHLVHSSLGPPESSIQTTSRSVQPFLQGSLVWQTDWPTDHTTRSVTIDRITYVTAMRSKNLRRYRKGMRKDSCSLASCGKLGMDGPQHKSWDILLSIQFSFVHQREPEWYSSQRSVSVPCE